MNPPGLMTRLLGTLPMTIALYIGCATAVVAWTQGKASGWAAIGAVCLVQFVRKASAEMRRYKQRSAAWQAMGNAPEARKRRRIVISPRVQVALAVLSLLMVPLVIGAFKSDPGLQNAMVLLWLVSAVRLLWAVAVRMRQGRLSKKAEAGEAKASTDVVKWALPRASSSPSRAEATKHLPAYCVALLQR